MLDHVDPVDMEKRCACSGVRSCLLCENVSGQHYNDQSLQSKRILLQCYSCGRTDTDDVIIPDTNPERNPMFMCKSAPCVVKSVLKCEFNGLSSSDNFSGVTVVKDFLTKEEEKDLVDYIDGNQWVKSQSGRLKQVRIILVHMYQILLQPLNIFYAGLWSKS